MTLNRPEQMGALTVEMRNQMLDELEISLECQGGILSGRMKRRHEDPEPQTVRHHIPLVLVIDPRPRA